MSNSKPPEFSQQKNPMDRPSKLKGGHETKRIDIPSEPDEIEWRRRRSNVMKKTFVPERDR